MNEKKDDNLGNPFADAPVIFSYTRAQAIEDGVLVDLSEWAKETGFKTPVACTSEVWHSYITPPKGTPELGQSERGRAHDVLWMLFVSIKRRPSGHESEGADKTDASEQLLYKVLFLQAPHRQETVELKAICGPGDQGEPVLTIMMPYED